MEKRLFSIALFIFGVFISTISFGQSTTTYSDHLWQPNGEVIDLEIDSVNNRVYYGGYFSYVGPNKKFGCQFNINALSANLTGDHITGATNGIKKVIPDGNDGWILLGNNIYMGEQFCGQLAHINSTGESIYWNKQITGSIWTMELSADGNFIYIGGNFDAIDGEARSMLAKLDLYTGELQSWNPGTVSSPVEVIKSVGNSVFIAGNFTTINAQTVSKIAKIDGNTATVDPWLPVIEAANIGDIPNVKAIAAYNNRLYIAGGFATVDGQSRENLAAFDLGTLNLSGWTTNVGGSLIKVITPNEDKILLGGSFTYGGNFLNNGFIALDSITGDTINGMPNFTNSVFDIAINNNKVYCVGDFTAINGQPQKFFATLDPTSLQPLPEVIHSDGISINSIAFNTSKFYLGGNFSSIGGKGINRLAAVDLITGKLIDTWTPNPSLKVNDISVVDNTLYVAGMFNTIAGENRNHLAAFDRSTLALKNLNPTHNGNEITDILVRNNKVYFTGDFTTVNGSARTSAACIDTLGNLKPWNPTFDYNAEKLAFYNESILVGGEFNNVNGQQQNRLCKLDTVTGTINGLPDVLNAPNFNTFLVHGDKLYVAGENLSVPGFPNSKGIGRIDLITNTFDAWHLDFNYSNGIQHTDIKSIQVQDTTLYLGGDIDFTSAFFNGFSTITGIKNTQNSFGSYISYSSINDMILTNNQLLIGGDFNAGDYFGDNVMGIEVISCSINPSIIENTFAMPSAEDICNGELLIEFEGDSYFGGSIFNNSFSVGINSYDQQSIVYGICSGIYDFWVQDFCGNSQSGTLVVPVDSNYVFNNPFIDSLAQDSLGTTIEDCDIYYAGIDTAYIDSIWATGNTVNVIWNIVDSNGSNLDTTTYELNNGNGVYWLQLSVFCPTKALGDYFTVTEAIYFEDGDISTAGIGDFEETNVMIYPNPTNDLVTISFDGSNAELTIYDAQGKVIRNHSVIHSGEQVSLANFQTGVYFFELSSSEGKTVKRVVKN